MGVNEAGAAVENMQHLLVGHSDHVEQHLAWRMRHFSSKPIVHTSYSGHREMSPLADYRWMGVQTAATSAWKAVRIAKVIGYTEIILCGCPLEATGYAFKGTGVLHGYHMRIGEPKKEGDWRKFENYRLAFARKAKDEGENVYSMSGYTREKLGEPEPRETAAA